MKWTSLRIGRIVDGSAQIFCLSVNIDGCPSLPGITCSQNEMTSLFATLRSTSVNIPVQPQLICQHSPPHSTGI
ncbi:hypothetical protein J6590_053916 [Homalodisca vitripennis]|nr:hypothetical protein J6590_053916 [Homalodisca vitripennis]